MSLYCHGIIKVTTAGKITYSNERTAKIQFQAVSIDPSNKLFGKHSYYFELMVNAKKKDCVSEIVPGIICSIHVGRVESPEGKSFTRILLYANHFEILNINEGEANGQPTQV